MPDIELIRIRNYSCRSVDLTVRSGEFLVMAGATGAGKTTLLNVIAGLVDYKGSVRIAGTAVDRQPPAQRQVGYLFQDFALFPHMTVRDNIGFGLRARQWRKQDVIERVDALLDLFHMQPLAARYPHALSGGEKQRVALARTLAPRPRILLLDEPFSSLDPRTAKYLRWELKTLHRRFGLTAVYVTHNQMEAFEMADRIAVVDSGGIEQVSRPSQILFAPQSPAVAELFGSPNLFVCESVRKLHYGLGQARCGRLAVIVPLEGRRVAKIAVLPSSVHVASHPGDRPAPNCMRGRIVAVREKAPMVTVDIDVQDETITAELPQHAWDDMGLRESDTVYATIPLKGIHVLEGRS